MSSASNPIGSPSLFPYGAPEVGKGAAASASSNSLSEKSSNAGTERTPDQLGKENQSLRESLFLLSEQMNKTVAEKDDFRHEVSRLTKELQNMSALRDQSSHKMAHALLEVEALKSYLENHRLEMEQVQAANKQYRVLAGHSGPLTDESAMANGILYNNLRVANAKVDFLKQFLKSKGLTVPDLTNVTVDDKKKGDPEPDNI